MKQIDITLRTQIKLISKQYKGGDKKAFLMKMTPGRFIFEEKLMLWVKDNYPSTFVEVGDSVLNSGQALNARNLCYMYRIKLLARELT